MKFIKAEKHAARYYFEVWIDESQTMEDGSPHPDYIREYSWPVHVPDDLTESQYLKIIKTEIELLVNDEAEKGKITALKGF